MNIFSRLQAELKPRCNFAGPRVAGAAMEVAGEIRRVPAYNDMPDFNVSIYFSGSRCFLSVTCAFSFITASGVLSS